MLRTPRVSADLSFAYDLDWLRDLDPLPDPRPDTSVMRYPEVGVRAGLSMRFSLSSVRRALWAIGPVDGRSLSLGVRYNHPDLGSNTEAFEVTWRWQEFWQMPWAPRQTLSFRYTGGIESTTSRRDGIYSVGGLGGSQNIGQAIIDGTRATSSGLRGYPAGVARGRQFHLLNMEYRLPIRTFERGIATLPVYVRRLHAAALFDAGWAGDTFAWGDIRPSLGGVLRLDAVFGWYEGGSFELGFSRGLAADGDNEWWFLLTGGI
jgi:hypothetical protein